MNDAVRVATESFLTTADLAARSDFTLGLAVVSPSTRSIAGPGGTAVVEPRVMQVLVVLAEAAGQVVTRDTLFQRCWAGVHVGDDSLNRTVGAIRKFAAEIADRSFEIETIPRTGYRLSGDSYQVISSDTAASRGPNGNHVSRRVLIGTGAAAAALVGGGAWWWVGRHRTDPRFAALMAQGDEAFRKGTALDESTVAESQKPRMADLYAEAVKLNPASARAWGLLAYFSAVAADEAATGSASAIDSAQEAIRRALAIDRQEPNARVAMLLLQGPMLDWTTRDHQLRSILATDPHNLPAMIELMPLLQAAGLTRESWAWNERILQASPLARTFLVIRAMKLWILGNVAASDKVIDRVRDLWPDYPFAFHIRMMLFTLTGRPRATLAMIEGAPPNIISDIPLWRAAAEALDSRSPAAIERARAACLEVARTLPPLTNMAVMVLCALGLTETALDVTDGYLLWRGKMLSGGEATARNINDYNRRMTQWLFTPPAAAMRADPRFQKLCDDFGLTAYWHARGVRPDYQVYG